MDDIAERAYAWFQSAFIGNAANDTVEQLDYNLAGEALSELACQVTSLGKQLSKIKENELATALGSLQKFTTDLPQPDRVVSIQESPDTVTLDEFTATFDVPLEPELDSEIVWPAPVQIVP